MSTQDDPEDAPWLNDKLQFPDGPIQFYSQNVIPAAWHRDSTIALKGLSMTSAAGALTAHLNITITPPAGTLTVEPLQVDVAEDISVSDASTSSIQGETADNVSWVENLSWFIPKSIRDPWLGDLLEDRKRMADKVFSPLYIEWATGLQLVQLFFSRLGTRLGWVLWIYNRLSEWFHF